STKLAGVKHRLFTIAAVLSLLLFVVAVALQCCNRAYALMYYSDSFGRIVIICDGGIIGYSTEKSLTPAGQPDATWTYKSGKAHHPKGNLGDGIGVYIPGAGFPFPFYVSLISAV